MKNCGPVTECIASGYQNNQHGVRLENGIYGHSRFCNIDFEDIIGLLESIRRLNELNCPRLDEFRA